MFSVKLNVPRTIYINSRISNNDSEFKQVTKSLPRNRKVHQLFEWKTNEEHFLKKFHNLKYDHLMSKQVEGIYETRVPLNFRALVDGCAIVKPIKRMIPGKEQALGRTYKPEELQNIPKSDRPYLPSDAYEKIYLFHACGG